MKVVVSRIEDFPDGGRKLIDVNGRSVGVFRFGDTFYAIRNRCPHQWGPLCLGRIAPRAIASTPGQPGVVADTRLLACPWHGWEYDLATGQSWLGPGHVDARAYEVAVESGAALVASGVAGPGEELEPTGGAAWVPGPYKADTVTVYVEDAYVVVED